jgi:hypothetical protein
MREGAGGSPGKELAIKDNQGHTPYFGQNP